MNTHSKNADARIEILAANAMRAGISCKKIKKILLSLTTEEALEVLNDEERSLLMKEVLPRIKDQITNRGNGFNAGVILFSSKFGLLGMTENALELIDRIRKENI